MRALIFATLLGSTALVPAASMAQTAPGQPQAPAQGEQARMRAPEFVRMAAVSGMFEVESSRLALDRSQTAPIRQFAQTMIDDHTRANDELKALVGVARPAEPPVAGAQPPARLEIPSELDQKHTQMMDQLRNARDGEFDRLYARAQVQGHDEAVAMFRTYGQSGEHAQLKEWAQRTLPMLERHLATARTLEQAAVAAGPQDQQQAARPDATGAIGDTQALQVSRLNDMSLYDVQGREIGEVDRVVRDSSGRAHVVVGVGGFLNLGEKEVAIPLESLALRGGDRLVIRQLDEQQLRVMPAFNRQEARELQDDETAQVQVLRE